MTSAPVETELFRPFVRAGDFVFVSGQASIDPQGRLVRGTFEQEMRRSIENVRAVLAVAGLTLMDVVKVGSYVQDAADLPEYNRLYMEYFAALRPARTTITGCLPETVKFEMDVVAYREYTPSRRSEG